MNISSDQGLTVCFGFIKWFSALPKEKPFDEESPSENQDWSCIWLPIGHVHDGVILPPRLECFVKMLSYSNLSSLLGIETIGKISLTIEAINRIVVLVVK